MLVMLFFANEQGANLCADLRLMAERDTPDYDLVRLHVPLEFNHVDKKGRSKPLTPDENSVIRGLEGDLHEDGKPVTATDSAVLSVGNWSGGSDASHVFLSNISAPFQWGWGHAGNVLINVDGGRVARWRSTCRAPGTAPANNVISEENCSEGIAYVKMISGLQGMTSATMSSAPPASPTIRRCARRSRRRRRTRRASTRVY